MSLNAMQEAFKKAGFDKEVQALEEEKKKEAQKKIEQEVKREEQEEREHIKFQEDMKKKYGSFDEKWRDPKKQKFLSHLIFSFVPADVPYFAWGDDLKETKCCMCGQGLISKNDAFKKAQELLDADILREMLAGKVSSTKAWKEKLGDVMLGIVSPNSTAAFCNTCFRNFYDWIDIKILNGDTRVNRIVNRRRVELSLTPEALKEYDAIKDPLQAKKYFFENRSIHA